jgi:hypothetical protein
VLREVATDLWVAEAPFRLLGMFPIGVRMTVVRLPAGGLWLSSPVPLSPELSAALDAVGRVRFIVAPNRFHHLFVRPWCAAYPDAALYGAPGLADKRRDLTFLEVLAATAPPEWGEAIVPLVLAGSPMMNEVLFVHRPSRTLVVTDLFANFPATASGLGGLYARAQGTRGRFATPRTVRSVTRDRAAFHASAERLLAEDFDRVIVAHGDLLECGGKEAVRQALAWASV